MVTMSKAARVIGHVDEQYTSACREEMRQLGVLSPEGEILAFPAPEPQVARRAICASDVLNEADSYALPASFTRGLSVSIEAGQRILYLSGTSAVDENGASVHVGDFRAQTWRTYRNLTRLLETEGAHWRDIVRTSCYLRDIERDYDEFNRIRTLFFQCMGLDPLPASTGIQARLCRSDLLIEIEAFALVAS